MDVKKVSNYLFVGCTLIGVAGGMFLKMPAVGALLGVGIGFMVKAIYLHGKN